MEKAVYRADKKIRVLKKSQHGKIDYYRRAEEQPPPSLCGSKPCHEPSIRVIHRRCEQHQEDINRLSPGVKNQAEKKEDSILPGMSANPTITGNLLIHTFHCRLKSHSWKRFWDYDTFVV